MVDTTLLTVKMVHSSTTYWPATIVVSTVTTFTSSADDTKIVLTFATAGAT